MCIWKRLLPPIISEIFQKLQETTLAEILLCIRAIIKESSKTLWGYVWYIRQTLSSHLCYKIPFSLALV
jgi:hypothetical protein